MSSTNPALLIFISVLCSSFTFRVRSVTSYSDAGSGPAVSWRTKNLLKNEESVAKVASMDTGDKIIPGSNQTDFQFLINPSWLCSGDPEDSAVRDAFLLVLVHSRADTPAQRHAIRDTWGRLSRKFHGDKQIRVLFLLGDTSVNPSVIRESRLYRDIAMVRLQDTYRNLTLKALAGLHWIQKFCNRVDFVLKTDDDVYFHLPHLLQFLDTSSFSGRTPVILGSLNRNSSVLRYGLWEVDERDFPGERYPPYCSGNSYLLSTPAVLSLVSAARHVPTLPLEDVYLTGVLPPTAGLQCRHHPAFPHWITGDTQDNLCQLRSGWLFGIHNVHYNRMYRIQRFLDRDSNQSGSEKACYGLQK